MLGSRSSSTEPSRLLAGPLAILRATVALEEEPVVTVATPACQCLNDEPKPQTIGKTLEIDASILG